MKKLCLSAIIAIAFCGAVNAQLGITGGGNLAKYKVDDDGDRQGVFAWNAGLFYRIKSKHSNIVVQPALTYTGKGAEKFTEIDVTEPIEKYINRLSYLQLSVPIMYNISGDLGGDANVGIDFGVGPYVGRLLKASYTAVPYDEGPNIKSDYKIGNSNSDDFKSMDAGLTFMAGFKIAGLGMYLQYDLGLSNVNPVSNTPSIKTRAIMFNVFIGFGK